MNVPNYRNVRIRTYLDRTDLTELTDSDDALIIDTDGWRLGILPATVTPIELTDRVLGGSISLGDVSSAGTGNTGVDAVVATLTLELDGSDPNLAPLSDSPLNADSELLRPYQPVRVVATVDGVDTLLFAGYLGDEIRSNASVGRNSITISARDLAKPLQDMFIDEFPVLAEGAPVGIVSVLAELLDLIPPHLRPTLAVEGSPSFEVAEPYRPQRCTVWDAMQQLVAQTGWHLGVRGGSLVLLDPPRDKLTADWAVDEDDVFADTLGISDSDVRNVVTVVWSDADRERRTTVARDQWSIDNITGGIERASVIELDDTSQIDTETEAQTLADRFLHDMSREFAATQLTLPFMPDLRLFDTIWIRHERFTATPRISGIVSIRHDFRPGQARTLAIGTGQVIGRRRAWLDGEPRPGSPNDPRGPHQALLPAPLVTVTDGNPGIVVRVDERRGVDAQGVEIHWSLVNGFTPSDATLKGRGGQEVWTFATTDVSAPDYIVPGVTHYVRVRAYDSQDIGGQWTPQMAVIPSKVDPAAIILDSDVEVNGNLDIYGRDGNTGTLRFYDPGPPEVLKLAIGNVGGLFGAPSGAIGIAGALGSGAWFQGAPRVVMAGAFASSPSFTVAGNSNGGVTANENLLGPFSVPAGKKWIGLAVITDATITLGTSAGVVMKQMYAQVINGVGDITLIPAGGPYAYLDLTYGVTYYNTTGTNRNTSMDLRVAYVILEVDA